jgi:hypothetical protein
VTRRLAATALLGAILVACGQRGEKPPPPTCAGRCSPTKPIVVGQPGLPGSGGTGGTVGGGGASGEDSPVQLVGEVRSLDDIAAFAGAVYRDRAELLVEGHDADVRGTWTGADETFSLDGVLRANVVWARVTPGLADALPTLQPMDTLVDGSPEVIERNLTVVRESQIDLAFNVLALPVVRDTSLAQAVLVATKDNLPAEGIQVRADAAEAVIYADNGGFSDAVTSTDPTGIVLLANVPGSGVTVELSGEGTGRFDLRLLAGGVTVAGVGN